MSSSETYDIKNPALPVPLPRSLPPFASSLSGAVDYDEVSRSWLYEIKDGKSDRKYHHVINVAFLNGTDNQREKVINYSRDWLKFAPVIKLRFVRGVHGHIRVAFDEKDGKDYDNDSDDDANNKDVNVREISWSHVGRYSLNPISTPETMHLSGIEDTIYDPMKKNIQESKIIHHMFGHALGLRFAKNEFHLGPLSDEAVNKSKTLGWPADGVRNLYNRDDIFEPELPMESVMAFGWRYDICDIDKIMIANLYPIRAYKIRFSIQDFFEKSLTHQDDLDVYVLDHHGFIFVNKRTSTKKAPKVRGLTEWSYWTKVIGTVPLKVKDLAVLDLSDRLEFIIIDGGVVKYNYRLKGSKKWKGWLEQDKQSAKKNAKKIKVLQTPDGYEVFIVTTDNKLEHFTRRTGDFDVPKQHHPVPGSNIVTIHAARVGPATNPIQIYAVSGLDICTASMATPALTWSLSTLQIDQISAPQIQKIEFATVGDTRHAFIIDSNFKLHYNRSNDQGWFSWDDSSLKLPKDASVKIDTVAAGVVSSNDKEDDYMHVFILDSNGQVFYNRVDIDGTWGWPNDNGDVENKWLQSLPGVDEQFPRAKEVQTKRTKSGDLELFFITAGGDAYYEDRVVRSRLDIDGWSSFEAHIWWK